MDPWPSLGTPLVGINADLSMIAGTRAHSSDGIATILGRLSHCASQMKLNQFRRRETALTGRRRN
jgi:hypothetical protein